MAENSVKDIKEFFGIPGRPVDAKEMMDFWKACSEEEKNEMKTMDLGK